MLGRSIIEGIIFKENWFVSGCVPADVKMREINLYLDPSWGKKGCYKSVFAVGYDGFHYYVLKAWCRQCENFKMFEYLYSAYEELRSRFGYRVRFYYEGNYGQTRIMDDFNNWCKDHGKITISHSFKSVINRENKNLRIEALEPVIESGKIIFPEGQDMPTVISQFTSYPQGYIDAPDALSGCMARFHVFNKRKRMRVTGT
jgi:hypothetical protein